MFLSAKQKQGVDYMAEKAVKKTVKKTTAKKAESTVKRNEKGQFAPGESGNPNGRPKLSENFKKYADLAPEQLYKIATNPKVGYGIKSAIWEWFVEMYYGKARQQVDMESETKLVGTTSIKFEGELDKWSE